MPPTFGHASLGVVSSEGATARGVTLSWNDVLYEDAAPSRDAAITWEAARTWDAART